MSKNITSFVVFLMLGLPAANHAWSNREECLLYPITLVRTGTSVGGYVDRSGRIVVEPKFTEVRPFKDGMAVAKTSDPYRVWLVNCKGEVVPLEGAILVEDFSEGLAFIRKRDKSGFINRKAEMVITLPSDRKLDWDAPLAFGFKNGRAGLNGASAVYHVDRKGNLTHRKGVLSSEGYRGMAESVLLEEGNTIIDVKGSRLAPLEDNRYQFSDNDDYFLVRSKDGTWRYFDTNGNQRLSVSHTYVGLFHEGLAVVLTSKNGKYGYMNKKGEMVIPATFDGASDFAANGLAAAAVKGKVGIIDRKGDFLIEPVFAEVGDFIGDLIWVQELCGDAKGVWGFVDHRNRWVWRDNSASCGLVRQK